MYELSGGVDHDGEMGAFREYFVAELLRPTLPPISELAPGSSRTRRVGRVRRLT